MTPFIVVDLETTGLPGKPAIGWHEDCLRGDSEAFVALLRPGRESSVDLPALLEAVHDFGPGRLVRGRG